jgi:hypothetical protein
MSKRIVVRFIDEIFADTWAKTEVKFEIWESKHLTGHCHYMSPYEQDDICGNCDGAKCDYCREFTEVKAYIPYKNGFKNIIIDKIRNTDIGDGKFVNYEKAREIYDYIITNDEYLDEENDVIWVLESLESMEYEYPEYWKYITTEVYVVINSFNDERSILGMFEIQEEAEAFYESIKELYKNLPTWNYSGEYSVAYGKTFHGRDKMHGKHRHLDTCISVRKYNMGEITLLNFNNNEEGAN